MARSSLKSIVVASKEIKKLILKRAEELGVALYCVCGEAGIDYEDFKRSYINLENPLYSKLKEQNIIDILRILGIGVKITVIVTDKEKMNIQELQDRLKKHYTIQNGAERKDDKTQRAAGGRR